jgi:hypothetical protein
MNLCQGKNCREYLSRQCDLNPDSLIQCQLKEKIRLFWLGKTSKVRKATETYIRQIIDKDLISKKKLWIEQPFNWVKWRTLGDISNYYKTNPVSIRTNFKAIVADPDLFKAYFPEEYKDFFKGAYEIAY